jgi:hypothetical protein
MLEQVRKVYEGVTRKPFDRLVESVGDNKIDNLVDELKRSTQLELGNFVVQLLNTSTNDFVQHYQTPTFDGFKKILGTVVERYRVMDDAEKDDLFQKIELLFRDLMTQQYANMGPETSELIAARYAKQMQEFLKGQNKDPQQPIDDLYPHQRQLAPKAGDAMDVEVIEPTMQGMMKSLNRLSDLDKLQQNPY